MDYEVSIDKRALDDLNQAVNYYNLQQKDLGEKFLVDFDTSLNTLSANPFFKVRYDDYRCLPLSKFPYMIHYIINEKKKRVEIYGVIHTSLDPEKSWLKTQKKT